MIGKPEIIWKVGAWTPERLTRVCAVILAVAHVLAIVSARAGSSGAAFTVSAHFVLVFFYDLLYFEHVSHRKGVVLALADGLAGAVAGMIGLCTGLGPWGEAAGVLFVAGLVVAAIAFRKFPKHERW